MRNEERGTPPDFSPPYGASSIRRFVSLGEFGGFFLLKDGMVGWFDPFLSSFASLSVKSRFLPGSKDMGECFPRGKGFVMSCDEMSGEKKSLSQLGCHSWDVTIGMRMSKVHL